VNAIDIDLFVNSIRRADQLDELEHLLVKFRRNWRTRDTLPSTHHAVVRLFLQFDQAERLLKLLENRVWFGIFADSYCHNMLLDHFIEADRSDCASRVAILMALQEQFDNPIANRLAFLALASCLDHAEHSPLLKKQAEPEATEASNDSAENDEEEIEYRRVPYVRNPYFDDHFDLVDSKALLGKSLFLLAAHLPDATAINSANLIGLALYGKWTELLTKLNSSTSNRLQVTSDLIMKVKTAVESLDEPNEIASECLKRLPEVCEQQGSSLLDLAKQSVSSLSQFESTDQQQIQQLYQEWRQVRQSTFDEQLQQLLKQQRLDEVQRKRQELLDEEEKLFFFDNLSQIELQHEDAQNRIEELRSKMQVDEEYIPPHI
jgi:small subunit ribosomal protein S27